MVGIGDGVEKIAQLLDGIELTKALALALNTECVVFEQLEILYISHNIKFINADTHHATPVV